MSRLYNILNKLVTPEAGTLTYTTNSRITQANFANLQVHWVGKVGILSLNLAVAAISATWEASGTKIGNVGATLKQSVLVNIPGQSQANATLTVYIGTNGDISLQNATGTAISAGFFRACVPLLKA